MQTHSLARLLATLALVSIIGLGVVLITTLPVFGDSAFSGYAWSGEDLDGNGSPESGVGWVSINCEQGGPTWNNVCSTSNYKLTLQSDNYITGYAWSDNIGWIKFGGLSGFPTGSGTTADNAKVVGSNVVGWAKATAADGNGWDGWISMGGTCGSGCTYGATYSSGALGGYAWGSDVVGWLQFNGTIAAQCSPALSYFCTGSTSNYCDSNSQIVVQTPNPCTLGCGANGQCITNTPPSGCLSINTSNCSPAQRNISVRKGGSVGLFWSVADATSCTGTGFTATGSGNPITGTATLNNIVNRTVYKISCTGTGGSFNDSVTVNILPSFMEI